MHGRLSPTIGGYSVKTWSDGWILNHDNGCCSIGLSPGPMLHANQTSSANLAIRFSLSPQTNHYQGLVRALGLVASSEYA